MLHEFIDERTTLLPAPLNPVLTLRTILQIEQPACTSYDNQPHDCPLQHRLPNHVPIGNRRQNWFCSERIDYLVSSVMDGPAEPPPLVNRPSWLRFTSCWY